MQEVSIVKSGGKTTGAKAAMAVSDLCMIKDIIRCRNAGLELMTDAPSSALTTIQLEAGGFQRAGAWHRDEATGSIRFEGAEALPREPGVYAYAVGGIVHYVGSAQRGLRRRLRHYEIAKTLRTVHRVRQEILVLLVGGEAVEVFTIVPPPLTLEGGLPVDTVAGLEEALIRTWRPRWNRRSTGVRKVRT